MSPPGPPPLPRLVSPGITVISIGKLGTVEVAKISSNPVSFPNKLYVCPVITFMLGALYLPPPPRETKVSTSEVLLSTTHRVAASKKIGFELSKIPTLRETTASIGSASTIFVITPKPTPYPVAEARE